MSALKLKPEHKAVKDYHGAFEQFRQHHQSAIPNPQSEIRKWDIFHYVHAVLHPPEYPLRRIDSATSTNVSNSQSSQRLALETVVVEGWRSGGYLGPQKGPLPTTAGR